MKMKLSISGRFRHTNLLGVPSVDLKLLGEEHAYDFEGFFLQNTESRDVAAPSLS
jgi:hypothetical protein